MPSRRRRPVRLRTGVTAVLVLLAIVVAGYATLTAEPPAPGPSRASSPTAASPAITASADPTAPTATATATAPTAPAPTTTAGTMPPAAAAAHARELLAALPVKGPAPATGYDRTGDFGSPWLDVDHNGCDTRNDVLARDLTDVVRSGPCRVLSGELVSPYTGATIDFVRGNTTSTAVQIDHVVALENVWRTGGQQLTQDERQALANDPVNLFAVDQHSNAQKRSGDAATWLPADTAFRCTYVEHQVAIKTTYRLWVVPAERDAIERVLARC
ncbi:HNH endonuclease family protein [Curtobacterium sp. VKM Ac-1395]|uniref:HNH endonuclease family protein n=1 Tax=Curtobacterium sp. VKM Ac-1395 TaxID=2783815 RepID=UPI00188BF7A4|nr:HNH endonuclease family protein [Curtobacterium sp. VKM Ac-1395]MBF4591584.1 HNH endonuclease [Curtobacterium sp. VKM Ac-1395]